MTYKVVGGKLVKQKLDHWKGGRKPYVGMISRNPMTGAQGHPGLHEKVMPKDKGKYLGSCNRSACLAPGANWWNIGSRAYYCKVCADDINYEGCRRFGHPDILFEGTEEEVRAKGLDIYG